MYYVKPIILDHIKMSALSVKQILFNHTVKILKYDTTCIRCHLSKIFTV